MTGGLRAIAADVGGTFTDLIGFTEDGSTVYAKVPSTPPDFENAVLDGIAVLVGDRPGGVKRVLHATTAGTNAVLERTGGPAGLLTTSGFRDVLEIGRLRTPEIYNLGWEKPPALIPRRSRVEVEERLDADGSVHIELDPVSAAEEIARMIDLGVRSVAVSFLHSSANPGHERAMRDWLAEHHPDVFVTLASELVADPGEFERASTAALNAYLQPVVSAYLRQLAEGVERLGIVAPVYVMQSSGGLISADLAANQPVATLESGPAAGALAAADVARACDEQRVVALDMGGTTAKAALIEGGSPTYGTDFSVGTAVSAVNRLLRGGGYVVRLPVIDLAEVGAGGGSIASTDGGGGILVGPRSAGADPGPACYARGGSEPTVTDANMVLGLISAEGLAAGGVDADPDRAEAVIMEKLGDPLGLTLGESAWAIHTVANHQMALALRAVTTERGRTASDYTLVAFGGSGPLHGATLAASLGIKRVIIPAYAGVLSARGLLTAPAELSSRSAVFRPLVEVADELVGMVEDMTASLVERMKPLGFDSDAIDRLVSYDLRFSGQGSTLTIDSAGIALEPENVLEEFRRSHRDTYGHNPDGEVLLVAITVAVTGSWPEEFASATTANRGASSRVVLVDPDRPVDVAVVTRFQVTDSGESLKGPALVDDPDTTTYLPPGWIMSAASDGSSLLLEQV
ncbi:MAG TPA: hydantoinase/oxoprolinase family protein [Acidimicrobiia bacterium]|nr:hydantoinase/oxoprolinase family protein [Acidimicrobiia bacterium]